MIDVDLKASDPSSYVLIRKVFVEKCTIHVLPAMGGVSWIMKLRAGVRLSHISLEIAKLASSHVWLQLH